jgi:hypothetical protein
VLRPAAWSGASQIGLPLTSSVSDSSSVPHVRRDVSGADNPQAYSDSSCFRISAMRDSGLSVLIVAMGDPVGRAHQTTPLGLKVRTYQMSQFGYFGRSIASCCSAHSVDPEWDLGVLRPLQLEWLFVASLQVAPDFRFEGPQGKLPSPLCNETIAPLPELSARVSYGQAGRFGDLAPRSPRP